MTLDLTTLEASLKRDEELAARVPDPTASCDLLDALLLMDQLCGALLARVKDCRVLASEIEALRNECSDWHRQRDFYADAAKEQSTRANDAESSLAVKQIALDEAFAVIERQRASLAEAVRALEKIAAFHDTGANVYLEANGSYAAFDEPGSVRIARAALSSLQPRKDTP